MVDRPPGNRRYRATNQPGITAHIATSPGDRATGRAGESGPHEGTFSALWSRSVEFISDDGLWNIEEGSGDFADLQGGGEWAQIEAFDDRPESIETYTGEITR